MVTARSAAVATVVKAVDVSLPSFGVGSVVLLDALMVFAIVPPSGALALTWTTSVNVSVSPAATGWLAVAMMKPVPPGAGVVKLKLVRPEEETETNVVFAGTESIRNTPWASLGPRLFSVIV